MEAREDQIRLSTREEMRLRIFCAALPGILADPSGHYIETDSPHIDAETIVKTAVRFADLGLAALTGEGQHE